jgi:hypothetical protein
VRNEERRGEIYRVEGQTTLSLKNKKEREPPRRK